jgi:hypothetical protein
MQLKADVLFRFVAVLECKERWKNLRASFTRFLKSTKLSSGCGTKYKKPYYLAEYLHFLKPFTKSRDQSGILQSVSLEPDTEGQGCDNEPESSVSASKLHHDQQQVNEVRQNEDQSVNTSGWHEDTREDFIAPASKKIKRTLSMEDVNRSALHCCQARKRSVQNEDEDPDLSFFKSVLPDMREMNAEQKRRYRIGILSLAQQILGENSASSVLDTATSGS